MTNPTGEPPIVEVKGITKYFGNVVAIEDVSLEVRAGEVLCLLGDNGAGKSTVIKILSGLFRPDAGEILIDGKSTELTSPSDTLAHGIATVYQDLAILPLMTIARNFFLGSELTTGRGLFRRFDRRTASRIAREQMEQIGISVRDTEQLAGTLSGGERQTLAIARAEYFGARLLVLDEPTSALGIKEAAIVLRHIVMARRQGTAILLVTHNVQHARAVGDRFVFLSHGRNAGTHGHRVVDEEAMLTLMGGGAELEELNRELRELAKSR